MSYDYASVRNNSFSRTSANESKLGAYYTDVSHCKSMFSILKFPENEEVCCLEPSIGNGAAIKAVTGAEENPDIKLFGVELNQEVAIATKEDPHIEDCLFADFLSGVKISNNKFSFCFGNPPYADMDGDENETGRRGRYEYAFLEKVTGAYLKKDGILVWVIPHRIFIEAGYLRYLVGHYSLLHVYKFRKEEFAKWHQVVIIARKSGYSRIPLKDEMQEYRSKYEKIEDIEELPLTFEGTDLYQSVEVPASKAEDITLFATKELDPEAAVAFLLTKPDMDDFNKMVDNAATVKEYTSTDLGRPPIRLKKDLVYLMNTAGVGQGLVGTIGEDAHLQRGCAEVVEEAEYNEKEENSSKSDSGSIKVRTRTKVTMTVIQTNGDITVLE